jgi:hypothetical protein
MILLIALINIIVSAKILPGVTETRLFVTQQQKGCVNNSAISSNGSYRPNNTLT